jgi:hypothetical protein
MVLVLCERFGGRHHWLMPIILATQKTEIRRIAVQSQPEQIVCEIPSWKRKITKKENQKKAGRVAQREGPRFNS